MKKPINLITILCTALLLVSCGKKINKSETVEDIDFKIEFEKVAKTAVFSEKDWSVWGGSLVKGDDNLYHLFYSRWPEALGWVWVSHSEIAHATSPTPYGPFTFKNVALPVRGAQFWDGLTTHNPTIIKSKGKYYLYYMGTTGDGKIYGTPGKEQLNWVHRNNQRIGVAVADDPNGTFARFDKPIIDVSADSLAHDALMTSNPSICQRPDGGFLLIYKAVGKKFPSPFGGPVVHLAATSDSPTGPFVKHDELVFHFEGERFPAEDPYIWFEDGKYRAIVKRIDVEGKNRIFSLVHFESKDGIKWEKAKNYEISERIVQWKNGRIQQFEHLERPQVYIENGKPIALLCAADTLDVNNVRHSFNIQIPLKITKESRK